MMGQTMIKQLIQAFIIFMACMPSALAVTPPYFEGFESEPLCGTTCTSTCILSTTGWSNISSAVDDADWLVDSGGTSSSGTGPEVDHTLGNSAGQYLYIETSSPCSSQQGVSLLVSPPFELANTTIPQLSFWYHMLGAEMGTLHVDVLDSAGSELISDLIPPITDNLDAWQNATADLTPFIPMTIHIQFRNVHSGLGFEGDMAIDDVSFVDGVNLDVIFMDGFE